MSSSIQKSQLLKCSCCLDTNKMSQKAFIKDANADIVLCSECITYFNLSLTHIDTTEGLKLKNGIKKQETLPTPSDIFQALNRDVVKQDHAKRALSIAVAHHYRRLQNPTIGKSNILLIGPTGTGKTELVRSIVKYLNVPFASIDASSITAKGYIGEDADSVLRRLLISAKGNVARAEGGIVFIDEVDKLARRDSGGGGGDIGTIAVQQQLLKILEGDKVNIRFPGEEGRELIVEMDTSKILFICSGAFVGLDKIVNEKSRTIGIQATFESGKNGAEAPIYENLKAEHISKFGLIPEFYGRLPVVTATEALTVDDLIRILKEPQNSITKQYQALFASDNIELNFHDAFLAEIAGEAVKKGMGARGLRQVLEKRMSKINFEIGNYKNQRVEMCGEDKVLTFPIIVEEPKLPEVVLESEKKAIVKKI
jgi:ATP-dependent Clp protease ATP-binding subunit ClpX